MISEEITKCNQEKSEYFKKHEDQPNHFTSELYEKICDLEMQCYCDKHECDATINYVHHHDWGRPEDYLCENCLDNCEEQ